MVWILACTTNSPHVPTPAPLGSGEVGSREAQPAWLAEDAGYAPPAPASVLGEGELAEGALSERLLRCHLETDYRGDRRGLMAMLTDVDVTPPELTVVFGVGSTLTLKGEANTAELWFGAPAVDLERGDSVSAHLLDRKFMGSDAFDRLTGTYSGRLPIELETELSRLRCDVVPEAQVQAAFDEVAPAADRAIERYARRVVELQDEDVGALSEPHPGPEIQALAALRGWAHPDVQLRLVALDRAEQAFGAALVEALATAPEALDTPRITVATRGVRCPWFGYDRQAFECALELDVAGPDLYTFDPWLVWADGRRGREFVANPGDTPLLIEVGAVQPVALRLWTDDGPLWMRL